MRTVSKKKPRERVVAEPIHMLEVCIDDAGGRMPKPQNKKKALKDQKPKSAKKHAKHANR
jgi:hypothetical protein